MAAARQGSARPARFEALRTSWPLGTRQRLRRRRARAGRDAACACVRRRRPSSTLQLPAWPAGARCPKRPLTKALLAFFFSLCSLCFALRSPLRRPQVLAPLFPYLYFRLPPDPTLPLPPCAQFWRPTTACADATPAALRRSINTRSRCRCARSASELPRTAHSVAAAGGSPPPRAPPPPPMTTLARGRISCCSTPRSARCAGWGPAASRRIARRRFRRRSRRRRRRRPRRRRRRPPPRLAAARRARRAPPAASAGTSIDGGHPHAPSPPSRRGHSIDGGPLKEPTGCPSSAPPAVPAAPAVDFRGREI